MGIYKWIVYCKLLFNCVACPTLAPLDTKFIIAPYGQYSKASHDSPYVDIVSYPACEKHNV